MARVLYFTAVPLDRAENGGARYAAITCGGFRKASARI